MRLIVFLFSLALSAHAFDAAPVSAVAGGRTTAGPLLLHAGEPAQLSAAGAGAGTRWYVAAPEPRDYDNASRCPGRPDDRCRAEIRYRLHELHELAGRTSFPLAAAPELSAPGTHRLLALRGGSSDGIEIPERLADGAFELAIRSGDDYPGRMSELIGAPFVLNPVRLAGGAHQTDLRLGADCVAVLIYGRRRLGENIPYVAPGALRRFTTLVADARLRDGRFVDASGATVMIKTGDILHFGFQTAAVTRDLGMPGRLDPDDIVIHAYHGLVEEKPIRELPYRDFPVEVRRWP